MLQIVNSSTAAFSLNNFVCSRSLMIEFLIDFHLVFPLRFASFELILLGKDFLYYYIIREIITLRLNSEIKLYNLI